MSITAHMIGNDLVVDGVDFKRLARRFKQATSEPGFTAPQSLPEALEALARLLGYPDLHAVNSQARGVVQAPYSRSRAWSPALSFGEPFPRDLPDWINPAWRDTATVLVRQALVERRKDRVEFIALVGAEGAGKSILARHMAHMLNGAVLDLEADRAQQREGFDALMQAPKPVTFFDISAGGARRAKPLTQMMDVLKLVKDKPELAFVFSFDALHSVQNLLDSITSGNGKAIFEALRVVDLNDMRLKLLESRHPRQERAA